MRVFISHASKNRELAKLFVEMLRFKMGIPKDEIYCSSSEGQIELGVDFSEDIHKNLVSSETVLFLITEDFLRSIFCLLEMGTAWGLQKEIIPIVVPPVKLDVLNKTPLSKAQLYSLAQSNIGTILYKKLVASNVIKRFGPVEEQEFFDSLPELLNRIRQCMMDISGTNQLEKTPYVPISSNGNDQSIQLKQEQDSIEMTVDFSPNPMYGPCPFVSSVAEFNPPLNWSGLINTEAYLKFSLESPDHSVHAVAVEIKATEKRIKCFDKTYSLADGPCNAIIKINDMVHQNLLNEITQICIVARPNQVPQYRGKIVFKFSGLSFE